MLRLSIHAGPLTKISRFNRLDWVDIGYQNLAATADYKIVLFKIGQDAMAPVFLNGYPRWSASLWDLAARAIARTLFPAAQDPQTLQEQVPPAVHVKKKCAFAETLSAVIQHMPNTGAAVHRLGSMQIDEHKSLRCHYRAHIEEDLRPDQKTNEFRFAPGYLQPAELVLRAALFSMTDSVDVMPPRPLLATPKGRMIDGKESLLIHQLREPAKTGLVRWLYRKHTPPVPKPNAPEGIVDYATFDEFLKRAV